MKTRDPLIAMTVGFTASLGGSIVHSTAVTVVGLCVAGFFALVAFLAMGL